MKLKRMFLLAAVVCSTFAAIAQSTMTDIQVLEYVKSGLAQGKSQEVMMRELAARGVDRAQAERVKEMYESQKTAVAQEISSTVDDRAHTVAGEVDITPEAFQEDSQGPLVYGRDVFRNKSLNFAPSENLATPKNYRLGPGDEVIIDIFGANQVTLRNKISPEGSINVDVLGPLYLSGMTIEEANKYLKRKLAGIYGGLNRSSAGTDIRLSLGQIRSIQVNVLGDVNHAGTYVVSAFSTVFHVLYLAGGVVEPGSLRNITVNRAGKVVGEVDVYDFLMNGTRESDIRLEEGDVVMVRPYTCLVKIGGEVKRPMYFEMKDGESLQDLLDYAGGFAGGAYTDNVTVVRQNGRSYEVRTVEAADFKGFKMQNGDEVTVNQLNSYYENKLTVNGAVYQPGTYEFGGEVKTVRQLVAKAGGVLPDAFLNRAVLHREHDDKTLEVISVNLGKVLTGEAADIVLQKNDELYVTSVSDLRETGTMTISGMVANPGTFPFARNTTVEDLIIMAGGLREGASLARVDIARRKRDANGLVQSDEVGELISISLKDGFVDDGGEKLYLQPYDEVTVHRSPSYNVQTHVALTGEANFPGFFTLTSRNERLSDLVKKAGGVTNYAYVKGARLFRNMSEEERRQVTDILLFHSGDNSQLDTTAVMRMASQYQVAVNLDKALGNPGSEYDIELVEGDVLDIPVIHNTVRVMGQVMIPSVISYEPRMKGSDYIDACGGFSPDAKRAKKYVIHMNGRSEKLTAGTKIQPGDQIVVPARKKREGVADQTFARIATMSTTIASLGTTAATVYMLIMRNKNN
ncbi:MAG: SLBB domain-containing protein [Bacteroidales bacterium]|nr:SLBB domain-containing protein [Bacteroidales bacterium]